MKTIILIEDDPNTACYEKYILRKACPDCRIIHFSSGEEAYHHILKGRRSQSGNEIIHIFSDFDLPGINGLETVRKIVRELKKKKAQIPHVSFISSACSEINLLLKNSVNRSLKVSQVLNKPLDANSLSPCF